MLYVVALRPLDGRVRQVGRIIDDIRLPGIPWCGVLLGRLQAQLQNR